MAPNQKVLIWSVQINKNNNYHTVLMTSPKEDLSKSKLLMTFRHKVAIWSVQVKEELVPKLKILMICNRTDLLWYEAIME